MCATVTVIIPAYNAAKFLQRSVSSVLQQSYTHFELIIVDDGSSDGTPELCDELAAQDPRIRVIHQKNSGVGAARNAALDIACGRYIQFVDADDAIAPEMLKENVAAAEQSGADFVFFGMTSQTANSDGTYTTVDSYVPKLSGYYERAQVYASFRDFYFRPFPCVARMYRRSYIERTGMRFTDQSTEEDGMFNVTAYSRDFSGIYFNCKPYYLRLIWPGSAIQRYHKDRFYAQLNVNRAIENLVNISGYGKTPEGQKFIAREYVKGVNVAMRNESIPSSGKNRRERVRELREWMRVPEIAASFRTAQYDQFKTKSEILKFFLLRHGLYSLAVLAQEFYTRRVKTGVTYS